MSRSIQLRIERLTGPCAAHILEPATRATSLAVQSGSQQQLASHFLAFKLHVQEQSNCVHGFDESTQLQPGGGFVIDVAADPIGEISDHTGNCAVTRAINNAARTPRIIKGSAIGGGGKERWMGIQYATQKLEVEGVNCREGQAENTTSGAGNLQGARIVCW